MSEILYDHYKDTCSITLEAAKRRDRLLVYVVVAMGILAILGVMPEISDQAINEFLNFKFGFATTIDLSILGSAIWFLLLLFILRYFQVSIFVERQYPYLHQLEERIENGILSREGKGYLVSYPIFSNWMWLLYTVIFPTLLLSVTSGKIVTEITHAYLSGWSAGAKFNVLVFVLILISVILYLYSLHFGKSRDKSIEKNA